MPLIRRAQSALRRLFDANVIGIVVSNNAGAILEANDAFLDMLGYTRAELDSGAVDWRTMTPDEWLPLDERAIEELATTGIFALYEKEYLRKDGTRVPVQLGGARLDGTGDEQICYILDLSHIRETEDALRKSERRYRLLAEALPQVVMFADENRRLTYVNKYYTHFTGIASEDVAHRWNDAIHPDDVPVIDVARATGDAYEVEYRMRRASDGAYRWHFARTMPISDDVGAGGWLATAMDIDDRKRAEDALRFIEKAGARLSQSLDLQTTFRTLLELVVPEFGDWATITVRNDHGEIETIAARHRDPARAEDIRRITSVDYLRDKNSWGTAVVYRTGQPQIVTGVDSEAARDVVKPEFHDVIERLGYGSFLGVPIVSGDSVIGTLGVVSHGTSRTYSTADVAPLQELTQRAGFAIANARMFERERRVASLFQEAAFPRRLPHIDGFRFDAFYRAGSDEAVVGGDWYDALLIPDGRLVVSVGDVAGSGLQAAVLMASVRQVIRAAAQLNPDPSLILDVADRTLRNEHDNVFVTAFVGVIDPLQGTMSFASAGHLPALLHSADGTIAELDARGLPLGCRFLGATEVKSTQLSPDSCLLLYTDGLVEHSRDIIIGEELLRRRFGETCRGPEPARTLVESILGDEPAADDVAVLLLGITAPAY